MKVGLSGTGVIAVVGLVGLAAVGIWLYVKGPAFLKQTVTETLNPASAKNVVNQGVTSIVSSATGREESLGGLIADKVFEWTHPDFSFTAPVNPGNVKAPSPEEIAAFNAAEGDYSIRRMMGDGLIVN